MDCKRTIFSIKSNVRKQPTTGQSPHLYAFYSNNNNNIPHAPPPSPFPPSPPHPPSQRLKTNRYMFTPEINDAVLQFTWFSPTNLNIKVSTCKIYLWSLILVHLFYLLISISCHEKYFHLNITKSQSLQKKVRLCTDSSHHWMFYKVTYTCL